MNYQRAVTLNMVLGALAVLSLGLLLWQWAEGRRFPLHRRQAPTAFSPGITLLKPLKGKDQSTKECLRSWLTQDYPGPMQVLFGVGSRSDPAGEVVEELLREFPGADAQLVVCDEVEGTNAKVCKLAQMERLARHEVLVISDA
ncbi:MAG TPA: glycosyltransferase, partial [Clostridia bacterium]|nr:glycosyltransferase [Clostridia bacterium]